MKDGAKGEVSEHKQLEGQNGPWKGNSEIVLRDLVPIANNCVN